MPSPRWSSDPETGPGTRRGTWNWGVGDGNLRVVPVPTGGPREGRRPDPAGIQDMILKDMASARDEATPPRVQGAGRALLRGVIEGRGQVEVNQPTVGVGQAKHGGRSRIVKSTIQWATAVFARPAAGSRRGGPGGLRHAPLGLGPADRAGPSRRAAGHPAGDPGARRPDRAQPRPGRRDAGDGRAPQGVLPARRVAEHGDRQGHDHPMGAGGGIDPGRGPGPRPAGRGPGQPVPVRQPPGGDGRGTSSAPKRERSRIPGRPARRWPPSRRDGRSPRRLRPIPTPSWSPRSRG